jgi:protein involved in polysaccharide export with SLBB domain
MIGASRLSVSELADLRRSFVVRGGKKLSLDMERLYAQGDLTQNVFLEPGDYIYVASNVDQECYVLGSVGAPGEVPLDTPLTVTGAIAAAKGFSERAWKAKVLIVRGNLSDPLTEVIDMRRIFDGTQRDVAMRPGDIVYISDRPWSFAEDLLDAAIRSFIQGSAAAAFETRTSISVGR